MDKGLIVLAEAHPTCNVTRVDRYGRRMTCGVAVSSVERRNKGCREREVRALELLVHGGEARDRIALFLVEVNESLQSQSRQQECRNDPYGIRLIPVNQQRDKRHIQRERQGKERTHVAYKSKRTRRT